MPEDNNDQNPPIPSTTPPNSATLDQPPPQPQARLDFTEYELQVLETITQKAIDEGVLRVDLLDVVASVQHKVKTGRSDLQIARRRLAVELANKRRREAQGGGGGAGQTPPA